MTDLFRSAFNYLSQAGTPSVSRSGEQLVGTNVEVGGLRLRIRSLLAEGGFALVFSAQDSEGHWYALKRQLAADRESAEAVLREIRFLRLLTGHSAIIRYVQAAQLSPQESGHGRAEFLLLTELCSGGPVVEVLQKKIFSTDQVLKIFYAGCSAIRHMHAQKPSITHRDMKIENLLFDSSGFVKLCDFGSATTDTFTPDDTWNVSRRTMLEEEMARHTTPMYRAPEMLDTYMNYPVGPAQDVWALGCILYYLCYRVHPFEDSAKLRIINAKFTLPEQETPYSMFHPLIQTTLKIDPRMRPLIGDLCERTEALAAAMDIDLSRPVLSDLPDLGLPANQSIPDVRPSEPLAARTPTISRHQAPSQSSHHQAPSQSSHHSQPPAETTSSTVSGAQQQASAMLGALKGQGISLFKNLKDKSAAVVQTVQSTYGSKGPDVTSVTSRLVLAPLVENVPDALAVQAEEVLMANLMEHRGPNFVIFNLGIRRLRADFGGRASEMAQPPPSSGIPPTLNALFAACHQMTRFLKQNDANYCVLAGPEVQCACFAVAMLVYSRLVPTPLKAHELIYSRRGQMLLPPSYHRQLELLTRVVSSESNDLRKLVNNRRVQLDSVFIEPLPLFNRLKTGCRPFAEVYCGGVKVHSTLNEYDQLVAFETPDCQTISLPLGGVSVSEDATLVIWHGRWTRVQGKMQQQFMLAVGLHTMFLNDQERSLRFSLGDVDHNPDDEPKFGDNFRLILAIRFEDRDGGFSNGPPIFLQYDKSIASPTVLISDGAEYDALTKYLGIRRGGGGQTSSTATPPPPKRPPPPASQSTRDNFFETLDWGGQSGQPLTVPSVEPTRPPFNPPLTVQPVEPTRPPRPSRPDRVMSPEKVDNSVLHERQAGIRVGMAVEEDPDAHLYKFDYEKKNPTTTVVDRVTEEADLLNIASGSSSAPSNNSFDPFGLFETGNKMITSTDSRMINDRLLDWTNTPASMHRNVSAPAFDQPSADPLLADFFAPSTIPPAPANSKASSQTGSRQQLNNGGESPAGPSGRSTPTRPSYSRTQFDNAVNTSIGRPKLTQDTFDDLLSGQGFTANTRLNANRSIGDMRRAEEIKEMDPVMIKIRDWTQGKQRNIRALLGSMNDVLWPGADRWAQPSMSDLLTAGQVKKCYYKACLVVHPDKLTGTPNEHLARAIFTELNDAWNDFEKAGAPSL